MTKPNVFDEINDFDDYMPEFGLYGKNVPSSCFSGINKEWDKSEIESEHIDFDPKTLLKQFESLNTKIEQLNKKIIQMEEERFKVAENTLIEFWDNDYDDQWNDC